MTPPIILNPRHGPAVPDHPADSFVTVDDSDDMEHLSHRLVRTSLEGLKQEDVDKIKEMLG